MIAPSLRTPFRGHRGFLILANVFALLALLLPAARAQLYTEKQTVPTDTGTDDSFGWGVAAGGDTSAVGASNARVFIYGRSGNTWTLQQTVTARGEFGLDGNTLVNGSEIYERV